MPSHLASPADACYRRHMDKSLTAAMYRAPATAFKAPEHPCKYIRLAGQAKCDRCGGSAATVELLDSANEVLERRTCCKPCGTHRFKIGDAEATLNGSTLVMFGMAP